MTFKSPLRGVQAWRRRQDLALGGAAATYASKVLGYGPIAYWPLWETSGTTAVCQVNSAQNGTYSSDVSTWPVGTGIGDGNTCPTFDGTNDYISITTTALASSLDLDEGSAFAWCKVANSGVWTDGANREIVYVADDTDYLDILEFKKLNTNTFTQYRRDPPTKFTNANIGSPTDWFFVGITWTQSGDELKAWVDGSQVGTTQTGLTTATLSTLRAVIGGGSDVAPASVWHGSLAHVMLFDSALAQAFIQNLGTV